MEGKALQERAARRAQELPCSELTHPFGEDWDVFKVRGKVFMLQTGITDEPIVVLKTEPHESVALRAEYPDVTPGYHMNKKHWITLHPGGRLDAEQADELVTDSYLLVVGGLPRAQQPVNPETFGVTA
ncbi:MmcQ/YjbR family DNA-binding protein [Luteococcus sediminum]